MVLVVVMLLGSTFVWASADDYSQEPELAASAVQRFRDSSGVVWRILHEDANGNLLIITEHVHQWALHSPSSGWLPLGDSHLRTTLDNWNLAPEVAANALTPLGANTDVRNTPGSFNRHENAPAGRTSPGLPIPAANAATGLFLLSISEVNEYFSHPLARLAYSIHTPGLQTTHWWLRSPGNPGTQSEATIVHLLDGEISPWIHYGMTLGVRPALWVSGDLVAPQFHKWFMQGNEHGQFAPHGIITRGEVAAILVRTFAPGTDPTNPPVSVFSDVANHWAAGYIAWAYYHGFVRGDLPDAEGNRTFRPTEPVLREELAAMTVRAAGLDITNTGTINFPDAGEISHWARPYIYVAVREGWLRGDGSGLLRPTDDIERAEAAAIVARALGRYGSLNSASLADVANNLRLFPDVARGTWFFYLVIEVSHSHYFWSTAGMERWIAVTWPT